ncbi:hypothetical protein D1872_280190 [compost metagenome]
MHIDDEPFMLRPFRIGGTVQNVGRDHNEIAFVNRNRPILYKKRPMAGHQIINFVGAVKMAFRHMVT